MKIPNAPLAEDQLKRILKLIVEMGNKMAFCESTGIDSRTFNSILERKWASVDHIELMMEYCDRVESLTSKNVDKAA